MSFNLHVAKGTIVGALGGLLFGFDTAVISGATQSLTAAYHLSPALLGFTVSSALWGTVVGALAAGVPGQRLGRRDSLRIMAVLYVVSALGCAFAWSWPALIVFRFIGGLGIGGSSVLGPMYIAEIAPAKWRGRLVGFFQVNIVANHRSDNFYSVAYWYQTEPHKPFLPLPYVNERLPALQSVGGPGNGSQQEEMNDPSASTQKRAKEAEGVTRH